MNPIRIFKILIVVCISNVVSAQSDGYKLGIQNYLDAWKIDNEQEIKKLMSVFEAHEEDGFEMTQFMEYTRLATVAYYYSQKEYQSPNLESAKKSLQEHSYDSLITDSQLDKLMLSSELSTFYRRSYFEDDGFNLINDIQPLADFLTVTQVETGDNVLFLKCFYCEAAEVLAASRPDVNVSLYPEIEYKNLLNSQNLKTLTNQSISSKDEIIKVDVLFIQGCWRPANLSKKELKEIAKMVKSGGRIILGGPFDTDGPVDGTGFAFYDKSAKKLKKCGFKIVERVNPSPTFLFYVLERK